MFGKRKADGSVGDLFAEKIIDRLPEIIPTASIEVARSLLEENGVTVSSTLATCTVRGVVKEMSKFKGLEGWKFSDRLVLTASTSVVNLLEDYLNKVPNNSQCDIYN